VDRIDEKLDRLTDAIFDIKGCIARIEISIAKHNVILEEHTRRSLAAEQNLELLREQVRPIEGHVAYVRGLGRAFIVIISIAGVIATCLKIFR